MLAVVIAVGFLQVPSVAQAGIGAMSSQVREWSLGGVFKLKHEKFLQWQAIADPIRPFGGWSTGLRATWILEVAMAPPKWSRLSLSIESSPAMGAGVGIVRPKLQYLMTGQTKLGIEIPVLASFRSAIGPRMHVLRPVAFMSGRF